MLERLVVDVSGQGLHEITDQVSALVVFSK